MVKEIRSEVQGYHAEANKGLVALQEQQAQLGSQAGQQADVIEQLSAGGQNIELQLANVEAFAEQTNELTAGFNTVAERLEWLEGQGGKLGAPAAWEAQGDQLKWLMSVLGHRTILSRSI